MSTRILVVEDSRTQAEQLRAVLEEGGYTVEVALDGEQAVAAIEARPADAVITDIVMPGPVDGFELCRRVKAGKQSATPVMLVTSLSDPTDIIQALEAGADNFLRKPYDPEYLLERLRVLFATREIRAKNRVSFGMKVLFMGREVSISSGHQQVLDLLISTFEEAVLQNRELRQREEELRIAKAELDRYAAALEQRLKSVLETIPDALFSVDASLGNLFYISAGAPHVFGYTPEEMTADPQLWRRSVHAEDLAAVLDAFNRAVESRLPQAVECRFKLRDGEWRWIQLSVAAVNGGPEARVRLDGVAHDVTRRKEAERRERLARDVLELLNTPAADTDPVRDILRLVQECTGFDAVGIRLRAPDGDYPYYETRGFPEDFVEAERYLGGHDRAGNIVRNELGNPVLECMCGNVLCGRTDPLQPFFTEAGSFWTNSTTHLLATTTECERQGRTRNRCNSAGYESMTLIPLRSHSEVIGLLQLNDRRPDRLTREAIQFLEGLGASIGIALSRKRAEQHLFKLRKATDSSGEVIFMTDHDGMITDVNPEFTRVYGYTAAEVVGKTTPRVLKSSNTAPEAYEAFWRALLNKQVVKGELVNKTKDGRLLPIESSANPVLDSQGDIVGFLAIQRDITERKQAEEALRRSEADYRGLVEHAPLGIYRSAADGRFLTVNRALVEMLRYESADEVLRLDINQQIYADPEQRAELVARVRNEDETRTEAQWKCGDGSLITVQLNVRIVRSPTGQIEYFEGLVEDVSQQRSLENQFRQAQRMEAVGRLAGGVAHDFNNILTVIVSASELLLADLGSDDPKRQDVEEIRAAAQRATGLTRQLLAFSRRQVLQLRVLSLNGVVEALNKMLRRLIGEDVTLEVRLDPELGAVRADPGQIEQVILNVVVNSRDAMPTGGRLTVETSNVDLDEAYAQGHTGVSPGRYVMLAVNDTGVGMDAETQAHIFEPFFTTKELGKGTGLGLATVYGIVKQCRGNVWVYSEPGRGTTFKIYLPRVDAPLDAPDLAQAVQPSPGGHEIVLLAEDDASVRRVVAEALEKKGYRVLVTPDGQAALETARAQPGEIQLLITDLIMPGMTGRELAEVIVAERPHIRVLYMSGYTDDAVVRHGVLEAGVPYLQKPFTPGALAFKVREALDLPPSA